MTDSMTTQEVMAAFADKHNLTKDQRLNLLLQFVDNVEFLVDFEDVTVFPARPDGVKLLAKWLENQAEWEAHARLEVMGKRLRAEFDAERAPVSDIRKLKNRFTLSRKETEALLKLLEERN